MNNDDDPNEERANTVCSLTHLDHYEQSTILKRHETITTPKRLSREMTMAAPPRLERQETMAAYPPPPILTRQTAFGVSNANQERPPSRWWQRDDLFQGIIEPMYRDDLEAQIKDLQKHMVEMREQIAFLLQKIETKENYLMRI